MQNKQVKIHKRKSKLNEILLALVLAWLLTSAEGMERMRAMFGYRMKKLNTSSGMFKESSSCDEKECIALCGMDSLCTAFMYGKSNHECVMNRNGRVFLYSDANYDVWIRGVQNIRFIMHYLSIPPRIGPHSIKRLESMSGDRDPSLCPCT